MSIISSFIGTQITVAPSLLGNKKLAVEGKSNVGLVIENSSRPQKKATAHHRKTRPRKTQPWDINRKPTVYAPLPPLPPDWTLLAADNSGTDTAAGAEAEGDAAAPSPAAGAEGDAAAAPSPAAAPAPAAAQPSPAAALEAPDAGA